MKKLTIGRDDECDIIISDPKGLVSRKHAILIMHPLGKTEIIDVSKNGTFLNGIRLQPHKTYRINRKDVIVFANSAKLDWKEIPDRTKVLRICVICLFALIAVGLCFWLSLRLSQNKDHKEHDTDLADPLPELIVPDDPASGMNELSPQIGNIESLPTPDTAVKELNSPEKTVDSKPRRNQRSTGRKQNKKHTTTENHNHETKPTEESKSTMPEEKPKFPGGD